MLTVLREAGYFTRHHFQPLLQIAMIYTLPSLGLELGILATGARLEGITSSIVSGLFLCLGVIQFGAAILFIHHRVTGQPIAPMQAVNQALARLGGLMVVNLIMGVLVFGGLMLLVVPGVFFAYKLLFAELYLLLEDQDPIASLKSSYQATTGQAGELLPPLLIWGGAVVLVAVAVRGIVGAGEPDAAVIVLQHLLSAALSMIGWALIYRLYQRYIVDSKANAD